MSNMPATLPQTLENAFASVERQSHLLLDLSRRLRTETDRLGRSGFLRGEDASQT